MSQIYDGQLAQLLLIVFYHFVTIYRLNDAIPSDTSRIINFNLIAILLLCSSKQFLRYNSPWQSPEEEEKAVEREISVS